MPKIKVDLENAVCARCGATEPDQTLLEPGWRPAMDGRVFCGKSCRQFLLNKERMPEPVNTGTNLSGKPGKSKILLVRLPEKHYALLEEVMRRLQCDKSTALRWVIDCSNPLF